MAKLNLALLWAIFIHVRNVQLIKVYDILKQCRNPLSGFDSVREYNHRHTTTIKLLDEANIHKTVLFVNLC